MTKKILKWTALIVGGFFVLIIIIGVIVAVSQSGKKTDVSTSDHSVVELKMNDLVGFELKSQQGSIYSYETLGKNQSVTVAKGMDNLEGHQDLYPLSRAKVTIADSPIDIGYNKADDYGSEAYTSLSFDFKYKGKNLSGEISNLDFKSNKDGLRKTLDMYITALEKANK